MDKRCPEMSEECTCEELYNTLRQAMKVAELALVIIATLVPAARVLRAILAAWRAGRQNKRLEQDGQAAAKTLEDGSKAGRIIEGEFEAWFEAEKVVLQKMGGKVEIKP